eukprot:3544332-Alexandrium_andersonii.AAC.1
MTTGLLSSGRAAACLASVAPFSILRARAAPTLRTPSARWAPRSRMSWRTLKGARPPWETLLKEARATLEVDK